MKIELMDIQTISDELGIDRSTLWRWRKLNQFPKGKKMPSGKVVWRRSEVVAWFLALDDAA